MNEAVTDIIVARARRSDRLSPMLTASVVAHVGLIAFIFLMPESWRGAQDDVPRTVMTISLGGAPGPRSGGMTTMGGRAVQAPAPPTPTPPRAAPQPTAKPPEMALPDPKARQRPPQARPDSAVRESTSRTPTTGPQPQEGNTRTDTGARGRGFGLTTGGGGGTGATIDVQNFCCPEYLEQMLQLIQRNWQSKQGVAGAVVVRFTIARTGEISDVQISRPSGFTALDLASQRALLLTARVPPLPAPFPNPTLTVNMRFEYSR